MDMAKRRERQQEEEEGKCAEIADVLELQLPLAFCCDLFSCLYDVSET